MAQQQQQQKNSAFLLDALYCSEENWEDEVRDDYFHEELEESFYFNKNKPNPIPNLQEQDLSWDDEELSSLLSKEEPNQWHRNLETNPSLARARGEAVDWMLKVNAHYSFTALTAVLAINYLDRFLFSFQFQTEKPWMTQLVAVACLSLAAKVEETQVPLLLDLQVCSILNLVLGWMCFLIFGDYLYLIRWSMWGFFVLCRWRIVNTCLRQKLSREWRFWCSPRSIGRWIL